MKSSAAETKSNKTKLNDIIGLKGKVLSVDGEKIKARINGEIWACEAGEGIQIGDQVEVIKKSKSDLKLTIRKV